MIADFGLSRVMDDEKFHLLTEICGTPGVRPRPIAYLLTVRRILITRPAVHGPRDLQEK